MYKNVRYFYRFFDKQVIFVYFCLPRFLPAYDFKTLFIANNLSICLKKQTTYFFIFHGRAKINLT